MDGFLGIDVGSVMAKLVVLNGQGEVLETVSHRTEGRPVETVQRCLRWLQPRLSGEVRITAVGATGSGRQLTGAIVGADVVKNEITCHAVAASTFLPDVRTVMEIGGQDSKIIILRDGVVTDFGMNTVCAAGTGSFLDQQAGRLNLPIEEFARLALQSTVPVRIAGRCTVFAESDMVHKQQIGHSLPDILLGLCEALVRNYLNTVAKGKETAPPIVFQGGVAANAAIVQCLQESLGMEVTVPEHYLFMGAIGAALLAQEQVHGRGDGTRFQGLEVAEAHFTTSSFECQACEQVCEIMQIQREERVIARWGGRCDRWAY